ncbi:hypothetical protein BGZ54_009918 [Gamsiella multidivaricata]|nr:hypothetical protein BGZ54_009918 [Gamsiella multidivaricata]
MIRILEDDPVTNAGRGSNLNLDGHVECDASIMNGTTLGFGSIGAVSDFKNPISVAAKVLKEADQGPLSLGRIPPLMLVGSGVRQWVDTMGFDTLERVRQPHSVIPANGSDAEAAAEIAMAGSLVTPESMHLHIKFQKMLQDATGQISAPEESAELGAKGQNEERERLDWVSDINVSNEAKRKAQDTSIPSSSSPTGASSTKKRNVVEEDQMQDTVGAICVDAQGRMAAGVSSGGIAMKFPGRVSEAALFGAGCWAQDSSDDSAGFACSMTGAGEQICKTLLARTCMETMVHQDDTATAAHTVLERFKNSPLLRSYNEKYAGFIAVKLSSAAGDGQDSSDPDSEMDMVADAAQTAKMEKSQRTEFIFAYTTKTMGVAYMSTQDAKPTVTTRTMIIINTALHYNPYALTNVFSRLH